MGERRAYCHASHQPNGGAPCPWLGIQHPSLRTLNWYADVEVSEGHAKAGVNETR